MIYIYVIFYLSSGKKIEFATGTSKFYETAYIDTRQGPTGQQGESSVQGRLKWDLFIKGTVPLRIRYGLFCLSNSFGLK